MSKIFLVKMKAYDDLDGKEVQEKLLVAAESYSEAVDTLERTYTSDCIIRFSIEEITNEFGMTFFHGDSDDFSC